MTYGVGNPGPALGQAKKGKYQNVYTYTTF
jgi:hypothetical protein